MIFNNPVEVVFDTSALLGAAIFEKEGREKGALEYLNAQCHKLVLSREIVEESTGRLWIEGARGSPYIRKLLDLLDELERKGKVIKLPKKIKVESIELEFQIPEWLEHDIHILKTAVAIKRKGMDVCIVHKNPGHFEPVKDEMLKNHGILVRTAEEYVYP